MSKYVLPARRGDSVSCPAVLLSTRCPVPAWTRSQPGLEAGSRYHALVAGSNALSRRLSAVSPAATPRHRVGWAASRI
jgi:hypothetical protein